MMIYRCIIWRRAVGSLLPSASADGQMIVPALPVPMWVLTPLNIIHKGAKAHKGRGLASRPFKPSAEADGKREPAA